MEVDDDTQSQKHQNQPNTDYTLSCGISTHVGMRRYQEDRAVILLTARSFNESYKKVTVAAVYDGHAGCEVAEILKDELHEKVLDQLYPGKEEETLVKVFREIDDSLFGRQTVEVAGSCAIFSVLIDGTLITAGVGDCEGVLVKVHEKSTCECISLNTNHKGTSDSEIQRIKALGGHVFFGRVFGQLAVTRAFGDFTYKKQKASQDFVSVEPSVTRLQLDPSCSFIILASDGLWDVCCHDEAGHMVTQWILKDEISVQDAADKLIVHAQKDDTCSDNITVVILQLHWNGSIPSIDPLFDVKTSDLQPNVKTTTYGTVFQASQVFPTVKGDSSVKPSAPSIGSGLLDISATTHEKTLIRASQALPPGEGDLWLKTVKGKQLTRSYMFLDAGQKDYCKNKLNLDLPLPCWVSQEDISRKLFGEDGVKHLKDVEAHYGKHFLWANVFSNVHSNFKYTEKKIIIDGVSYHGPEQYFQQQKSVGTLDENVVKERMQEITDPGKAFTIGRFFKIRSDWEDVKESVMRDIILEKYMQQEDLRELLLETEGHLLVQMKPSDTFWGTGSDGKGKNTMGVLTMNARSSLLITRSGLFKYSSYY